MGFSIEGMPILATIGDSNRKNRVITSNMLLVPLLEALHEKIKADAAPNFNSEASAKHFVSNLGLKMPNRRESVKSAIKDIESNLRRDIVKVAEYQNNLNTRFSKIRNREIEIADQKVVLESIKIGNETQELLNSIKEATTNNEWDFVGATGSSILFAMRTPAILHHINKAACVDIHEDMGYFMAKFDTDSRLLSLYPYKNARLGRGIQHPHANGRSVCWGDVRQEASSYMSTWNFPKLLELSGLLLTQYGSANPYVGLEYWIDSPIDMYFIDGYLSSTELDLIKAYQENIDYDKFAEIEAERIAKLIESGDIHAIVGSYKAQHSSGIRAVVVKKNIGDELLLYCVGRDGSHCSTYNKIGNVYFSTSYLSSRTIATDEDRAIPNRDLKFGDYVTVVANEESTVTRSGYILSVEDNFVSIYEPNNGRCRYYVNEFIRIDMGDRSFDTCGKELTVDSTTEPETVR